jgi:glycosyltransferase involved in cell wall biosynthesis
MNILQVVDYFKPFWSSGGPARVCYEIARRFADMGHKVTIYSNGERRASEEKVIKNQPTTVDGMTVWYFKNLSSYLLNKTNIDSPYLLPIIARRKLREFDVIHIHTYRSVITIPIWYYAKKYGIPYTLQAHGSLATSSQKGWLKRIFDKLWGYRILRDAAKVIALTQTEAGQYKSMGVPEDKIEIVPNGIDLSEFETLPQRGEFRSKYGLNSDQKMVLYLGRIDQTKGIDLLARAFADLVRELKNTKLVIVGPDEGYLPRLRKLVKELNIEENVLFTGALFGNNKLQA